MAYAVIWSNESLDDIDELAETIARDSLFYAQRVVDALFAKGDSLNENPKRGRVVPELNHPAIREVFIYSYRLLYEITDDEVHILAIIHGRRLLDSLDDRFSLDSE